MAIERDENGRYKKGSTGNPGGSSKRAKQGRATAQSIIDEDTNFEAVWAVLIDRAIEGRPWAIKLYLAYRAGSPTQSIEIDADVRTSVAYDEALDRVYGATE